MVCINILLNMYPINIVLLFYVDKKKFGFFPTLDDAVVYYVFMFIKGEPLGTKKIYI